MKLNTAEKQFLTLLRGVERQPKDIETGEKVDANIETLKKRGKFYFSEKLDSMTFNEETILKLFDNKLVEQQETIFKLTNEGKGLAKKARKNLLNKNNNDIYKILNSSKTLANITKQVYGKDLGQNNMMTMPELNVLLEVLKITPEDSVIDLGCGTGKITEYISDVTQAQVIGIDIASEAIKLAQERTQKKKEKLEFRVDDMDDLSIPPASVDCVIAIDSLYFVEDLENTLVYMKTILKPQGRMGLFYSASCLPKESKDKLHPDKTKLAKALQKHDLNYQTFDFSIEEKEFWNSIKDLYVKYKEGMEQEGNLALQKDFYKDAEYHAKAYQEGRRSRHLYVVTT